MFVSFRNLLIAPILSLVLAVASSATELDSYLNRNGKFSGAVTGAQCAALMSGKLKKITLTDETIAALEALAQADLDEESVTALRGEVQTTVRAEVLTEALARLEEALRRQLTSRDASSVGRQNITSSVYMGMFESANGLSAKMRARQYFEGGDQGITPSSQTNGKIWLEIKRRLPNMTTEHDQNIKVKHRYLLDLRDYHYLFNHQAYLENPSAFLTGLQDIGKRLQTTANLPKLSHSKAQSIPAFLKVFEVLHRTGDIESFEAQQMLGIQYARTAYKLLIRGAGAMPGVQIQITVDESIQYMDIISGDRLDDYRYGPSVRVVEVKLPVPLVIPSDSNLRLYPELAAVYSFLDTLRRHQIQGIPVNSGKSANRELDKR